MEDASNVKGTEGIRETNSTRSGNYMQVILDELKTYNPLAGLQFIF